MEKISIKSSKELFINGILHKNGNDILIITVHGFKDNMDVYAVKQLSILLSQYYSVFRFTFPDVEKSTDNFNLIEEVDYLNEVISYFSKKYKKIILVGGSLGALVCSIASIENNNVNGLISLNGMTYFWGLSRKYFRYLALILLTFPINGPYAKMYKYYLKSFKPEKITANTLIITSKKDEIINHKQSLKFFSLLKSNKKIEILSESDHGLTKIKYVNEVSDLIVNWLKEK